MRRAFLAQQANKGPTTIERSIYDELSSRGIAFEKQKLIGRFLVDTYIPHLKLVIECDGSYWHALPHIQRKDKAENAYLAKCGYSVVRLSQGEIETDPRACIDRVLEVAN